MRARYLGIAFLLLLFSFFFFPHEPESMEAGIEALLYSELRLYAMYSSAVYREDCPKPLGNTLIKQFYGGFVVRDEKEHHIIVAFRGTHSVRDIFLDTLVVLMPLEATGVVDVGDSHVHTGFLLAYNTVARIVLNTINAQVAAYPSYKIVVTGHSLGGAVASIAALSIKAAVPNTPLKLFTYGQPRTGNEAFASLVESRIGTNNIFRVVHSSDGIPNITPAPVGYRHFGTEYWNFKEPESPSTFKKCNGREDPTCSASMPLAFLNKHHLYYFGLGMGTGGQSWLCT